jgi:hypothetical protein
LAPTSVCSFGSALPRLVLLAITVTWQQG